MDQKLQTAEKDEHGSLMNPVLAVSERNKADGLRSRMLDFMCDHYDE